jgi:hypothetical protein
MYQVNPVDLVTTKTIGSFRIDLIQLVLFKQANISVVLYDTNGVAFDLKQLHMTGADYDSWSTDDNFVVDFVCAQLGLTIQAPVAEAPVAEAPVAEAPVTEAPVAEAPVTEATP